MLSALAFIATLATSRTGLTPRPVKFVIQHADPYLVKAFLEGRPVVSPEVSLKLLAGGPMMAAASQAAALFQGGYWFVNPTDNSLWLVPNH